MWWEALLQGSEQATKVFLSFGKRIKHVPKIYKKKENSNQVKKIFIQKTYKKTQKNVWHAEKYALLLMKSDM